MSTPKTIAIKDIKLNDGTHGLPKNPRLIKDERFRALCQSIRDNPEYMPARPIIVNEDGVILGGNMRYRACVELGMAELPSDWVKRVAGWSVEKQRRFILLDNRSFGENVVELILSQFDNDELLNAGFLDKDIQELIGQMPEITDGDDDVKNDDFDIVGDKEARIIVRLSFNPATWLGAREQIIDTLQKIVGKYECIMRVEE